MTDISKGPNTGLQEKKCVDNRWAIYGLTLALSLILFFAHAATNDILNDDGINYIYAAHALSEGLLDEAEIYRPEVHFYRQIVVISTLSGLDLYPSAHLLSLFWQILLAGGFIAIVRCFDTSIPSQLIALAVFFSMASLNHLRPDIIRGFGFWALQLWAIWAGLNFLKHKAWRFALLWLGFSVASILYRAEGIVYLLLIPLFTLFSAYFTGQLTTKTQLKIVGIILFTGAIAWLFLSPETKHSSSETYRPTQSVSFSAADKLQNEFTTLKLAAKNFDQLKDDIATLMPNKWAERSVNDLLIGGFIFHLLVTLLKTTNTPLMILSLYRGDIKRPFLRGPQYTLLASYILMGILIGLMSVYNKYFLSTRYIMLTAILLAVPVTFMLSRSYSHFSASQQVPKRLWRYALCCLPLLACIYPLANQNDGKLYIRDAGQWVKTHIDDSKKVYFDEQKVAFYTANYANNSFKKRYDELEDLIHAGYQYAVLHDRKAAGKQNPFQQRLQKQRIATFENNQGRSVNVYKLPATDS